MCAVCWSAGQIIPASAAAFRYAQVSRRNAAFRLQQIRTGRKGDEVSADDVVDPIDAEAIEIDAAGVEAVCGAHDHDHDHEPLVPSGATLGAGELAPA